MDRPNNIQAGFTLIELLLVVALLAMMAAFSFGNYRNYAKNVEMNLVVKNIIFDLRHAQAKAMGGEDRLNWGIHLVNGNSDYYELFSTPTDYADGGKIIISSTFLPASIYFADPAESAVADIIFSKITGTTISTTIRVTAENVSTTISVSSLGAVY